MLIIFPPLSVNEMTDLLVNYALKFPVDAVLPAAAEAAGQWVENPLPLASQPANQSVSPAAATGAAHSSPSMGHWGLHLAARSRARGTRTGLFNASIYFFFIAFIFWIRRSKELFWIAFSFSNFHLWFANMGSSCGFSRGNIVVVLLLLLLEGKVHHQLHCLISGAQDEVGNNFKCM